MRNVVRRCKEFEYTIDADFPVRIFADNNTINTIQFDSTIPQIENLSKQKGLVGHIALLPDVHEAYCMPVGCVIAIDPQKGDILPGGVGYDINCGIRILKTNLFYDSIKDKLPQLIDVLFNSIPEGIGQRNSHITPDDLDQILNHGLIWALKKGYANQNDLEMCENNGTMAQADSNTVSEKAKIRGLAQLGTIGSGNHFIEIQKVSEIHDEEAANKMGLKKDQITIMIHCGSRGLGHQVGSDYITEYSQDASPYNKQLAGVPFTSQKGQRYFSAMAASANYSWVNRQILTHFVRRVFWAVLHDKPEIELLYDVSHNIAKLEDHHIHGKKKKVLVHRKGAARAFPPFHSGIPKKYQSLGQPVIVSGSMGTASWVLLGQPNSMELSFGSTAHGAGRIIPRMSVKTLFDKQQILKSIEDVIVRTHSKEVIICESPQAYKDVDKVIEILQSLGITKKVAKVIPLAVIK